MSECWERMKNTFSSFDLKRERAEKAHIRGPDCEFWFSAKHVIVGMCSWFADGKDIKAASAGFRIAPKSGYIDAKKQNVTSSLYIR